MAFCVTLKKSNRAMSRPNVPVFYTNKQDKAKTIKAKILSAVLGKTIS